MTLSKEIFLCELTSARLRIVAGDRALTLAVTDTTSGASVTLSIEDAAHLGAVLQLAADKARAGLGG